MLGAPVLPLSHGAYGSWLGGWARSLPQPGEPQNLQPEWIRHEIWRERTWVQVLGGMGAFEQVAYTLRASTSSKANGMPDIKSESS